MIRRWLVLWMSLVSAPAALAQPGRLPPVDTLRVVELRLSDGSTVTGKVVAEDVTSLTLVTGAGVRMVVPVASLAGWREAEAAETAGRPFGADPNASRLFLGHTARPVPKGRGYVLDYLVFFPVVSYGLTDRFSLTGGMSLIPFSPDQLFYVAPKFSLIEGSGASLAAGVLYLRLVGFIETSGYAGVAYGITTLGGRDRAVTVLLGWPFVERDWSREPLLIVGGESRLSSRAKLLAELWKIPGTDVVPAVGGIRLIGERVSWDLGLLFLLGSPELQFGFVPWVDLSFHF